MIQQQSKLCIRAIKLMQWPTSTPRIPKSFLPSWMNVQMSVLPYSSSKTVVQAQQKSAEKNGASNPPDSNSVVQAQEESAEKKRASNPLASNTVVQALKENAGNSNPLYSISDKPIEANGKGMETTLKEQVEQEEKPPIQVDSSNTESSETIPEPGKEVEAVLRVKSLSAAMDLSANFNLEQRLFALKNLVQAQTRPLPLIQTLCSQISPEDMDIKQISDLLFLLVKLRYFDHELLMQLCMMLKNLLETTTRASVVGSAVTSLQRLQWKDPELLDELCVWIVKNHKLYRNISSFLYTLALQNHSPPNLQELLERVMADVRKHRYPPAVLVNILWSMIALDCKSNQNEMKSILTQIFDPAFLTSLADYPPVWMKLQNLHVIARSMGVKKDLQVPEKIKRGEFFDSVERTNLIASIVQLLFRGLDSSLYSLSVPSNMGFPIDLLFNIDKDRRVVPVHLPSSNHKRVAVMVHSYRESLLPTKEPNGYRVFSMKLLQDEYNVVSVPYYVITGGETQVHAYFDSELSKISQV